MTAPRILVTGESLIDMIPLDSGGARSFSAAPGGSPFNVAMALGRREVPVTFLGDFSCDAFGASLRARLEKSHVDLSLARTVKTLSTLGFVTIDPGTGGASYAFYLDGTAGCGLTPDALPAALDPSIRCLHFGSFSLAIDPMSSTLMDLASRESDRLIAVDPNVRPFLLEGRDDARERLAWWINRADLLKFSDEDLAWLGRDDPDLFAQERLEAGCSLVVMTRGGDGSAAWHASGKVEAPAHRVEVADTIGAGDTFQAGILAWLDHQDLLSREALATLKSAQLRAMLEEASLAAALNCTRHGCEPPSNEEIKGARELPGKERG